MNENEHKGFSLWADKESDEYRAALKLKSIIQNTV